MDQKNKILYISVNQSNAYLHIAEYNYNWLLGGKKCD